MTTEEEEEGGGVVPLRWEKAGPGRGGWSVTGKAGFVSSCSELEEI